MKQSIKQNGIELRTEYDNGIKRATLTSDIRIVDIYREHGGSWTITLSKRVVDVCGTSNITTLRSYTDVSRSEAFRYFENKQTEYGFFNDKA